MRRILVTMLVLVPVLALAACGGSDDDGGSGALPTPDSIQLRIFERSASECGSLTLAALASKYKVSPDRQIVAIEVGRSWAERFHGGTDGADAGRQGCLESFKLGPPRKPQLPPTKIPAPKQPPPPPSSG